MQKKLLILGATANESFIAKKAQAMGFYTITTDYNDKDSFLSPAKQISDASWDISWSDAEALEKACRKEGVEGVIAGFSEFRVSSLIELTKRLNLPCYITREQLQNTSHKSKFKELCLKNGLQIVKTYKEGDLSSIKFPVIIKPVDRAGSIGIKVAYNREELQEFSLFAKNLSPDKEITIETFVENGQKFDVYYYVHQGEAFFIGSSDTVRSNKKTKGCQILQQAWIYPSSVEQKFIEETHPKLINMLKAMNYNNGYVTMSAFYTGGDFLFFEAGFRLSGELSFLYGNQFGKIDYLRYCISYAMGEKTPRPAIPAYKYDKQRFVTLIFSGAPGKVFSIQGVEKIKAGKNIHSILLFVKENEIIAPKETGLTTLAHCNIYGETSKEINDTISFVNKYFKIIDFEGKSLIDEYCEGIDPGYFAPPQDNHRSSKNFKAPQSAEAPTQTD